MSAFLRPVAPAARVKYGQAARERRRRVDMNLVIQVSQEQLIDVNLM
jgi:hypothetical protein